MVSLSLGSDFAEGFCLEVYGCGVAWSTVHRPPLLPGDERSLVGLGG